MKNFRSSESLRSKMEKGISKIWVINWHIPVVRFILPTACQTMQRKHLAAIETRRLFVLPDYEDILGDHPFVATTLSWIANSYLALGDYDNAIKFTRRALEIREQQLGHHQETARSFYDLGVALSAKKEHERWVVVLLFPFQRRVFWTVVLRDKKSLLDSERKIIVGSGVRRVHFWGPRFRLRVKEPFLKSF